MYCTYLCRMVKLNYGKHYFATSNGDIITTNWRNAGRTAKLKPATDNKGYLRVGIIINGILTTKKVHRLICEAFNDNVENKPQVNHKNCDKKDNRASNLEWVTNSENMKHAFANGLIKLDPHNKTPKKGILNGMALLTDEKVLSIRSKFKKYIYTRKKLAKEFNVTESCIKDVILRKSWKHI